MQAERKESLSLGELEPRSLSKVEYQDLLPRAQSRLLLLQRACWKSGIGSVVVIEGWRASGKGDSIRKLTQRLEPRGFSLHHMDEPRTWELMLPWMWRFWVRVPRRGEMAIFDGSWHGFVLREIVGGFGRGPSRSAAYADIESFEHTLTADGYVFTKLFLHIPRQEQKARLSALEGDPMTSWRVKPEDWQQNRHYDDYQAATQELLEHTDSELAPWTLVEASDARRTRLDVVSAVVRSLEEGLVCHGCAVPGLEAGAEGEPPNE